MIAAPALSIIMATRNAAERLPRALSSLEAQTRRDFELVVQDACSSDATLRLFHRYQGQCSLRSEPDMGIYDAWNRAASRARGPWLLFLGADDMLATPDVLERAVPYLEKCPPETIFAYGMLLKGHDGKVEEVYKMSLNAVFINMASRMSLPFTATFVRTCAVREQGFDPSYRICGDYDFVARNAAFGNILRIPVCISYMEAGGISEAPQTRIRHGKEIERIITAHILPRSRTLIEACVLSRHDTDNDFT